MARRCLISNKGVLTGNNVSHANNKSRRRYLPNLQSVSLYSDSLKQKFKMRISTHAVRTIDAHGGLDGYIMTTATHKLAPEFVALRKRIEQLKAAE